VQEEKAKEAAAPADKAKEAEEKKDEAAGGEEKKEEVPPLPPPPPPEEMVMRVFMHCEGCARKVKKILKGFDGNRFTLFSLLLYFVPLCSWYSVLFFEQEVFLIVGILLALLPWLQKPC
jgi:hypothetical protein